ncbi:MAG: hypothetical protein ABT11_03330 [Novosphingobium sp. SCN 66-18]|nr:MAG: hypothetical protein ABT11_03330 [Novosphingobium sp. SCN 66-18]
MAGITFFRNSLLAAAALASTVAALPTAAFAQQGDWRGAGREARGAEPGPGRGGNRGGGWNGGGNGGGGGGGGWNRPAPQQAQPQSQSQPQPQPQRNWGGGNPGGWNQNRPQPQPSMPQQQAPRAPRSWQGGGDGGARPAPQDRGNRWQGSGWQGGHNGDWQRGNPNPRPDGPRPDGPRPDNARPGPTYRDGVGVHYGNGQWRNDNRGYDRGRDDRWRGNEGWRGNDGWRSGESWRGDRGRWNNGGGWNSDWRRDRRYDWRGYRAENRSIFRSRPYYAPYRGYSYSRLRVGFFLDSVFFGNQYWINDPWSYRLPDVYGPYRWVRYYNDVLLVDVYSGEVVDVIYDFFW